jgi:hypothetical protein
VARHEALPREALSVTELRRGIHRQPHVAALNEPPSGRSLHEATVVSESAAELVPERVDAWSSSKLHGRCMVEMASRPVTMRAASRIRASVPPRGRSSRTPARPRSGCAPQPQRDPIDRRLAAEGVGLQVMTLKEPAFAAAALGTDDAALTIVAGPDGPVHRGGDVARATRGRPCPPRTVGCGEGCLLELREQDRHRPLEDEGGIAGRNHVPQHPARTPARRITGGASLSFGESASRIGRKAELERERRRVSVRCASGGTTQERCLLTLDRSAARLRLV